VGKHPRLLLPSHVRNKKNQQSPVRGLQKLDKMCTAINLRFPSKLINERQTADSLSVDNMEESQVTTVEQNRDNMNYFFFPKTTNRTLWKTKASAR